MAGTKQPFDKSHFILPDLGEGVHEAELIKWRVKPGDRVAEHQTLAEMETDKALVEVPSPWPGVIKEIRGKEGDIIKVGSILVAYDVGAGTGTPALRAAPGKGSAAPARSSKKTEDSDPARRAGLPEREDAGTVVGSVGGSLTIPDRFARRGGGSNDAPAAGKTLATPAVRRIARELRVDISRVPGSGRGGRVTAADVQTFSQRGAPALGTPALRAGSVESKSRQSHLEGVGLPARRAGLPTPDQRIPFRGVRRKIAESLERSVRTAVHFTVVDEADVTILDRQRAEYAAAIGRKLSFLPFVMTAVCRALRLHPAMNANVDDENQEILVKGVVNLGCAVDTEHGLMVPVIANADALSIVALGDAVTSLAAACRDRTIPREKLIGGTFTISNVGSYGGRFATPIINYPEVGILAAGRVYEKVLAKDGMIYAGKALPLSLSCDHRVVDGAEGARFLSTVVTMLERPEELLRS